MTALDLEKLHIIREDKSLAPFLNDLSVIFSLWHASIRV